MCFSHSKQKDAKMEKGITIRQMGTAFGGRPMQLHNELRLLGRDVPPRKKGQKAAVFPLENVIEIEIFRRLLRRGYKGQKAIDIVAPVIDRICRGEIDTLLVSGTRVTF